MALHEFGAILWVERDIVMTTSQSKYDSVVNEAKGPGILLLGGHYPSSIDHYTHPEMYEYFPLRVLSSKYTFQPHSSPMLIYNTKNVQEHFMKWLSFCALDRQCIAPFGGKRRFCRLRFGLRYNRKRWSRHCHRFDQSAINILLINMFGKEDRAYISNTRLGTHKWSRTHFHRLKVCRHRHNH